MKIFIVLLVFAILLFACAPAPTPQPSVVVVPTARPPATSTIGPSVVETRPPTPNSISLKNVETQTQPNGEVRTSARVTTQDNIGLGQIEVYSPDKLMLGDTTTIRLRLAPATQLTSGTPVAVPPGKTPNLPNFVYRFSGNIQLYPLMLAELRALTFGITPTGPQRRAVESVTPVEWSWLANARTAGRQDLAIELSIPAIVDGVPSDLSTSVLDNIPLTIQVDMTVTATPDSFWSRVSKSLADNAGAIFIALIGLVGTAIGILVKVRSDAQEREKAKK